MLASRVSGVGSLKTIRKMHVSGPVSVRVRSWVAWTPEMV